MFSRAVFIPLLIFALLAFGGCAQPPETAPPQQEGPGDNIEQPEPLEEKAEPADNVGQPEPAAVAEPAGELVETVELPRPEETAPPAAHSEFIFERASGTITGYNGAGEAVVIPAKIDGVAVKHIGEYAFQSDAITSVVMPEGLESIGDWAFGDSLQIASITIPQSVKSIGEGAFWRTAITSIELPEGITEISPGLFSMCGNLGSVNIPHSVTSIGNNAFAHCYALTQIVIPAGVKSIGNGVFQDCMNLTEVAIPAGLESIGSLAFERCKNLTSITIPASVQSIGGGILFWSGEVTLNLDSANPYFVLEDGVLFNAARTELVYCAPTKTGDYAIPQGVSKIGDYAFTSCGELSSITVPSSVTALGDYAFISCGASKIIFMGERPAFNGAFAGAFAVEHIYYEEGAGGWPGEPIQTDREEIVPAPRP